MKSRILTFILLQTFAFEMNGQVLYERTNILQFLFLKKSTFS